MNKKGRPLGSNTYDPVIGAKICELIAQGATLNKVSKIDGFPARSTVNGWIKSVPEFSVIYAQARILQLEYWADQIIDIADDGALDVYIDSKGNPRTDHEVVNRSRLRIDSRKWLLSKLHPETYGDSINSNANQEQEAPKYVLKRGPNRKSKSDKGEDADSAETG